MSAQVLVVMGSDSDFPVMKPALKVLREFAIAFEVRVCSAHRTPEALHDIIRRVKSEGCQAIIAGAGAAAHLAGVCAATSCLPVIGVPIPSGALAGVDALYSTVQMPGGVPVASMGIGKGGAKNAGLFAVQIMARSNPDLAQKFSDYRKSMASAVGAKDARLQENLEELLGDD